MVEKLDKLDTREGIIAFNALLDGYTINEAVCIAENSNLWLNLESHIGIISSEVN